MTLIGKHIAAVLTAGAVAAGAVFGAEASTGSDDGQPTALVVDASLAGHGNELVDPRLEDVDAAIRLPRTTEEARANVRYFDALDYRLYVAGAHSASAAEQTGADATEVNGLSGALAAAR